MRFEAESRPVDLRNLDDVETWTVLVCRGWTLEGLARSVKVENTMDAVVDFLSKGFPDQAKVVVREVCERELDPPNSPQGNP
jgi:hypothetical protein